MDVLYLNHNAERLFSVINVPGLVLLCIGDLYINRYVVYNVDNRDFENHVNRINTSLEI